MARRPGTWILLVFALVCGGAAAWLALRYLRQQARPLLARSSGQNVAVIAVRDLPVGALVTERDVKVISWPGEAVPIGMLSRPDAVVGRGLITSVRTNEPFLETKLAPKGAGGGLPNLITEGMRALTVRVDDVVGVAGFVIPGTRVDVLLTMTSNTPSNEPTTRAILQNVQTLAAGQSIQTDAEGKPRSVPVITVLVTPEQAETLALAASQGRIQMALRNTLDTLPIRTNGARAGTLMMAVRTGSSGSAPAGWRRPGPVVAPEEGTVVEGFRGGERTLSRFSRPRSPKDGGNQ